MVSKLPGFSALGLMLLLLPCLATGETSFKILVSGDSLSANINAVPLAEIMNEIERQTKIIVKVDDTVSRQPVWANFKDLPLETGIRKLLHGHSFIVFYAGPSTLIDTQIRPQVVKISVGANRATNKEGESLNSLSRTQSTNLQDSAAASTNQQALSPTLALSLDHLWATVDQDAPQAKETLSKAIQDTQPRVRETALEIMASIDQGFVGDLLAEMALKDPEPEIRIEALNLLAEVGQHNTLNMALSLAVQDPDPKVQAVAADLIELLQ